MLLKVQQKRLANQYYWKILMICIFKSIKESENSDILNQFCKHVIPRDVGKQTNVTVLIIRGFVYQPMTSDVVACHIAQKAQHLKRLKF